MKYLMWKYSAYVKKKNRYPILLNKFLTEDNGPNILEPEKHTHRKREKDWFESWIGNFQSPNQQSW